MAPRLQPANQRPMPSARRTQAIARYPVMPRRTAESSGSRVAWNSIVSAWTSGWVPVAVGIRMERNRSIIRTGRNISSHASIIRSVGWPRPIMVPVKTGQSSCVRRDVWKRYVVRDGMPVEARFIAPPRAASSASRTRVEQLSRK